MSPEELHGSWTQSYLTMGWGYDALLGQIEDVKKVMDEDPSANLHLMEHDRLRIARQICQLKPKPDESRQKVICLCGSTRFTEQMLIKQWELTKQGHVVLSWCALPESYFQSDDKTHVGDQEGVKEIVDEVHLRKIDLADEVLVLNVDGYIGQSTRGEIEYAKETGKPVRYLDD